MARGYLGKISAVISANTGDYVRKLNESAKETANFAKSVQQTLGRASSEARKSLESIYTPLQQVERALRAASSQKLSFRGFDGAIRDVQSLQAAIAKLTDQKTIDLVVKTSGAGSLDELKRTINVLRNQDVTIGVEGLRQQRAAIGDTSPGRIVATDAVAEANRLDTVIAALEKIDAESLKKISIQVESQQLDAAALKLRQLVSAGKEIGEPLARAAKQYDALSLSVQAAFGPALKRAQQASESLTAAIDSNARISQRRFAALRREVELTEAAIKRLGAAEAIISKLGDGRSLRDVAPRQFDALNAAAATQQRSDALSGQTAAGFGVGKQAAEVRRQAELLNQMRAKQEGLRRSNGDTTAIDAAIERQTARLEKQLGVWKRLVSAAEDYDKVVALRQRGGFVSSADLAATGRRNPADVAAEQAAEEQRKAAERDAEQRRRAVRAITLPIDNRESSLITNTGLSTNLGPRRFTNAIGKDIDSLKGQIRSLGDTPLAAELGSQVDSVSNKFSILNRDVALTEKKLVSLAAVQLQTKDIRSAIASRNDQFLQFVSGAGGGGRAGLNLGIDQNALRSAGAEIDLIQKKLSGFSLEARGPAVAALENYRLAVGKAFREGTISTDGGKKTLEAYRKTVIDTTSRVAGLSPKRLAADLKRVGDVARGSFGNVGLAVQQAIFAFDDFFSVTGGLDQRIRAAGNNISQLGFILGGTAGLISGVLASALAQGVVALIKYADAGRTSEDRTKALSDALQRQKSIVDELAQSYRKVAEAIQDAGLSDRSRRDSGIRRQVEDIRRQQQQAREQRILGTDEGVAAARASVAQAEREIGGATTAAQQVRAQLRLNQAMEQQRLEERRALQNANAPVGDVRATVISALTDQINSETQAAFRAAARSGSLGFGAGAAGALSRANEVRRQNEQRIAGLQGIGASPDEAIRALESRINELVRSGAAADIILPLEQVRRRLLIQVRQIQADSISAKINERALRIADALGAAQSDLEAAFTGGVGTSAIESELAGFSASLQQFTQAAADAATAGNAEQARAFSEDVVYIGRHVEALKTAAQALRLLTEALTRAQQAVQQDVETARSRLDDARRRETAFSTPRTREEAAIAERQFRDQQDAARRAQLEIERQRAAQDDEAMRASGVLERRNQLQRNAGLARGAIDQERAARAQFDNAGIADTGTIEGNARAARAAGREDIAKQLEDSVAAIQQARSALGVPVAGRDDDWFAVFTKAVEDFKKAERAFAEDSGAQFQAAVQEINAINQQLSGNDITGGARQQLLDRRSQLQAQIQPELDRRERAAADAVAIGQREAEVAALQNRGREILNRQSGKDVVDQLMLDLEAIRQEFGRRAEEGNGLIDQQGLDAARKKLIVDTARQQAPNIFGLADSVANAVLQGPSRAALQPTDVSTMEGSRELTRLLRGDDAAKDQASLVELQKEANGFLREIANGQAQVAN